MANARAVRIPAARDRPDPPPSAGADAGGKNLGGQQRARRTGAIFSIALLAIYLALLADVATSPDAGVRSGAAFYLLFTALFLGLLAAGAVLSLRRAPRSVARSDGFLVFRGPLGSSGSFPWDDGLSYHVVERYPAGLLASEPTEVVRVAHASGLARTYLVEQGLLPTPPREGPPRADPAGAAPR